VGLAVGDASGDTCRGRRSSATCGGDKGTAREEGKDAALGGEPGMGNGDDSEGDNGGAVAGPGAAGPEAGPGTGRARSAKGLP